MLVKPRIAPSVFLLAALALPHTALAAPEYYLVHNSDGYGNTGPIETVGPQNSPIDYDFPYQETYFTGANHGEVHANVNPGSLGITALASNNGGSAPQRQEVSAQFSFDVIFSSPGSDPIDAVMNMNLSGEIFNPLYLYSTVQVSAGRNIDSSSGEYREIIDTMSPSPVRSGMLSSFVADGTDQTISTNVMSNVPVNVPVRMFLQLDTIQPYTIANPMISFGSTLSLTTSGNVFSISGPNASAVTVNSTDAGIVDNRYVVPEPCAITIAAFGMLGLCGLCRRMGA